VRRVPFSSFVPMVLIPDQGAAINRVPTRWSSLNGHSMISVPDDYLHQLISGSRKPLARSTSQKRSGASLHYTCRDCPKAGKTDGVYSTNFHLQKLGLWFLLSFCRGRPSVSLSVMLFQLRKACGYSHRSTDCLQLRFSRNLCSL
jgi:hypothetical protein